MKHRLPTAEERKLWLESNRLTRRLGGNASHEDSHTESGESEASSRACPGIPRVTAEPVSQKDLGSGKRRGIPGQARDDALTQRLSPLRPREAAKRFRNFPLDATLDLHGFTKLDAREKVQQFLLRQAHAHRRHVVIITGKGKGGVPGVLREHLPDWLAEPPLRPLISAIAYAPPEKGGAGVLHVLLKANR